MKCLCMGSSGNALEVQYTFQLMAGSVSKAALGIQAETLALTSLTSPQRRTKRQFQTPFKKNYETGIHKKWVMVSHLKY